VVVYMGRSAAPQIARDLIAAGRDPATPVLVAIDVSLPSAGLVRTRLDALAVTMLALPTGAPTTLMIGEAFAATSVAATAEPALT
jgi:uroporphyrin-III C-methyltransferase